VRVRVRGDTNFASPTIKPSRRSNKKRLTKDGYEIAAFKKKAIVVILTYVLSPNITTTMVVIEWKKMPPKS